MRSPYHGSKPPYRLPSNIVYFHDWRYVSTGSYAWLGPQGEHVPMMGPGKVPPMHYEYRDMPLGIHLEAQRARKSEMVLSAERTGDACLFAGSLIREEGIYRLWYENWLKSDFNKGCAGQNNALRYAESTDGIHWKLPRVGRKYPGEKNANVVYGADMTRATGFHGGCVFKDPSAPAKERYKAFHLGHVSDKVLAAYRKKYPRDIDPMSRDDRKDHHHMLCGAVSPDGIHWRPLREPLLAQVSDTHNICEYDPALNKYVAYIRTWILRRRSIGRTVSDDFRHFEFPEEIFWPDAMQKPYDTWYVNGKTVMPDAPDYHIMFPMRWSLPRDRFEFHLATSPDNVIWGFVPGGPVCEPGDSRDWDASVVVPGHGMVELSGHRMGILYSGTPIPHKYPRRPPLGAVAWASWPKGRLVALKSPEDGNFATWPLLFQGRSARLNFKTAMTGFIQVEAWSGKKVLPERSFADCDPINGDKLDRLVTWRGKSDLGHAEGAEVTLRFRLRNAELYSIRFG